VVLALGVALLLTGMVTSIVVSILGVALAFVASVGWFRQVLANEAHQPVRVHPEP
jgi:positive regulator of sigma E activity